MVAAGGAPSPVPAGRPLPQGRGVMRIAWRGRGEAFGVRRRGRRPTSPLSMAERIHRAGEVLEGAARADPSVLVSLRLRSRHRGFRPSGAIQSGDLGRRTPKASRLSGVILVFSSRAGVVLAGWFGSRFSPCLRFARPWPALGAPLGGLRPYGGAVIGAAQVGCGSLIGCDSSLG